MSKRGLYIGGGTLLHANPKDLEDLKVSAFKETKRDIIAEVRKERRDEKAKRAVHPHPNKFSPIKSWSAATGVVQLEHQPRPRNAR